MVESVRNVKIYIMKRFLSIFAILSMMSLSVKAVVDIPSTTANFDVIYHWGLINKVAGHAYINYHTDGNEFMGSFVGHSIPWDGRVYSVESSLGAIFVPSKGGPSQEIVTGMQGVYTKPKVGDTGNIPYKNIYGEGTLDASAQTMEAVNVMTQMISMFYYAKDIDFASLKPGEKLVIPIQRGKATHYLYITYSGQSHFSYSDYSTPAYKIVFQYTYHGAPDRYPVTCLIGRYNRMPVQFSANLLIGHVRLCYVPQ